MTAREEQVDYYKESSNNINSLSCFNKKPLYPVASNEGIKIALREFDAMTQPEKLKLSAMEVLQKAAKDLLKLEQYNTKCKKRSTTEGEGFYTSSVKLKITSRDEINNYRDDQKKKLNS